MAELWVARVASKRLDAAIHPWQPDVPAVMLTGGLFSWKCLGGIPTDKVNDPVMKTPLTTHLLIEVPNGQEVYVTGAVNVSLVPQTDQLTIQMIRDCGTEYEANADAFFASIPNLGTGNAALKTIAKELLEQARPRGLSAAKAESIRALYGLPTLSAGP